LILATINFLAAASPGPDFIVVSKNSIFGSRKIGFFTIVGVGVGILTHVFYSILSLGFIIS
jgi:threonine/homoserine/homoserine lactone efflux protein